MFDEVGWGARRQAVAPAAARPLLLLLPQDPRVAAVVAVDRDEAAQAPAAVAAAAAAVGPLDTAAVTVSATARANTRGTIADATAARPYPRTPFQVTPILQGSALTRACHLLQRWVMQQHLPPGESGTVRPRVAPLGTRDAHVAQAPLAAVDDPVAAALPLLPRRPAAAAVAVHCRTHLSARTGWTSKCRPQILCGLFSISFRSVRSLSMQWWKT